jgi:hypothetical protein
MEVLAFRHLLSVASLSVGKSLHQHEATFK